MNAESRDIAQTPDHVVRDDDYNGSDTLGEERVDMEHRPAGKRPRKRRFDGE